jgi:hypothetical protein
MARFNRRQFPLLRQETAQMYSTSLALITHLVPNCINKHDYLWLPEGRGLSPALPTAPKKRPGLVR